MQKGYFKTGRKEIIKCYRNMDNMREYLTKQCRKGGAWRLVGEYQDIETAEHLARQHVRLFISSGFDVDPRAYAK